MSNLDKFNDCGALNGIISKSNQNFGLRFDYSKYGNWFNFQFSFGLLTSDDQHNLDSSVRALIQYQFSSQFFGIFQDYHSNC